MLELRFIRENLDLVKEKSLRRGMASTLLDQFAAADGQRLIILSEVEGLKNKRNIVSENIASLKKGSPADRQNAEPLILEMRDTNQRIKELDGRIGQG